MAGKLLENWRVLPLPLDNLDRLRLEEPSSSLYKSAAYSGPTFYRCWLGLLCHVRGLKGVLSVSAAASPSTSENIVRPMCTYAFPSRQFSTYSMVLVTTRALTRHY